MVRLLVGPEGTFIGNDNDMGLALIMTIPLLRYLQLTARRGWINHGLIVVMVLCVLAAVGSQSRGALVGMVAMGDEAREPVDHGWAGGVVDVEAPACGVVRRERETAVRSTSMRAME